MTTPHHNHDGWKYDDAGSPSAIYEPDNCPACQDADDDMAARDRADHLATVRAEIEAL